MSKRIDWFYADGRHEHIVYGDITAQIAFENMAVSLRSGASKIVAEMLDEPMMTTVVIGSVNEEPWF